MKITEAKTAEVRVKIDDKRGYLYHYVRIFTDEGVYGTGEASHVDGGWRGSTRSMAEQIIGNFVAAAHEEKQILQASEMSLAPTPEPEERPLGGNDDEKTV